MKNFKNPENKKKKPTFFLHRKMKISYTDLKKKPYFSHVCKVFLNCDTTTLTLKKNPSFGIHGLGNMCNKCYIFLSPSRKKIPHLVFMVLGICVTNITYFLVLANSSVCQST
jgi:hypothetical protein